MSNIELSIVMPCLNEAKTIGRCVFEAANFLKKSGIQGEIVVADNGSTDGSQEIAIQKGARIINVPVRGYGAACIFGISAANGRFVIMGDADSSYNFELLEQFLEKLRSGADVVNGNRFLGGIEPGAMPWKNRFVGNPILSGIGKVFFNIGVNDFHCGLRGFRRDAFLSCRNCASGMEFASEMLIKAALHGQKIVEVPTTLRRDGRERPPHLRPWRDGWRHLRLMMLFAPTWTFVVPGLLLLVLGASGMIALSFGNIHIGLIELSIGALAYFGVAALLGFQTVFFGVFAKLLARKSGLTKADSLVDRFRDLLTVERALIVGAILIVLGLILAAKTFLIWGSNHFGELDPTSHLRTVLPAVFLISFGWQVIIQGFFFSVINISVITPQDTRNMTGEHNSSDNLRMRSA